MSWRSLVLTLMVTAVLFGSVQAEELHPLGAIREDVLPSWILPSPEIVLDGPSRELDEFIDNSAGLPPVGNQGSQGSCTAWAAAYYCLTYYQGQDYGWDLTDRAHQMSPAFTYNLINGGGDNGSQPSDAFRVFETLGCATYEDMPYNQSNCTRFPSEDSFHGGMPFRTLNSYSINVRYQNGITQLKTYLANGGIALIAMMVYSNFDNISSYDYTYCVADINSEVRGGHAVTVIGYDDARVTADGVGAFKMVNSWGTGWGQSGFWWMSYEAMMSTQISWGYALYASDRIQHEPSLVAYIEPTHEDWYSLEYTVGVGTSSNPIVSARFFEFGAGNNPSHSYQEDACIVLDLSDMAYLISETEPNDLFVRVDDRRAYNGLYGTVDYVMVEDVENEHYAMCYETPVIIPDNSNDAMIDLVLYHAAVPPASLDSELDLSDGSTTLTWPSVPGGNDFEGYNVYRDGELIGSTEELTYVDELTEFGEYDYQVASLWAPCPSWPSEATHVNWIVPVTSSYTEVTALNGATGDFTLGWEQLRSYRVKYDDGWSNMDLVFSDNAMPGAMFAQQYEAEADGKLTRVSVYFTDGDYDMGPVRVRIFNELEMDTIGEELYTSGYFTPEAGEWKSVGFGTNRQDVQEGDRLWIAVVYEEMSVSALGLDTDATGSLAKMSPDGENWLPFLNGAIMIRGHFGEEEIVDDWTGLLGFDVYEDDALVATYNNDEHQHSGILPGAGEYSFRVDAVYQQGVWVGDDLELIWDGFTAAEELEVLPREFAVANAYPNPFNPSTTIGITIPVASELEVHVFNALGREVASLANGLAMAGEHRIIFDATGLASGVYFVHVQVPGKLDKRMKLVYLQ